MNYTIRPARPEDVRPAIDLALRVFMLYTAPLLEAKSVAYFRSSCADEAMLEKYSIGQWRMFVAFDGPQMAGMACERDGAHIAKLYVEPAYHRQGIATALLDAIISAMAVPRVTLDASPYGLPFYTSYGFVPTGEQDPWVPALTPMAYTPPVAIRPARPEEIPTALGLAQRIFQEFIRPGANTAANYDAEHETMFVAVAGERIVGMVSQRGGCHIRKLYVDGAWHRKGIAIKLLDAIIASMPSSRVTVNSSRYALPFYLRYGFQQTGEEQDHGEVIFTPMAYTPPIAIRPARPEDVRPAMELAIRVYMLYSAPLYERRAVEYFPNKCRDEERLRAYRDGKYWMFIAWDGEKLVGMAAQRGESVSHLFVEPAYHRRGIATKLMDRLIAAMGVPKVMIDSSPHAVPFYLKYGCTPTDKEQHKHGAIWTPMAYTPPFVIRPARPEDVRPALAFAQAIFEEFVLPGYDPPASERLRSHLDSEEQIQGYQEGKQKMFVAWAGPRIVGMVCERDSSHIRKLYVDGAYHRLGIATALMDTILHAMGAKRVTLNSSPHGLPFYLKYGFVPTDAQQRRDGFIFTPMAYGTGEFACSI